MWILFAALGAISKALTSFIRKKISKTDNSIYVFLSFTLISLITLGLVFILPNEDITTLKLAPVAVLISGLVQLVAIRINLYAFKHEELSYITPMFALTPLYAALIAFITIGEKPSQIGLAGVLTLVIGVYFVTSTKGIGPLKTLKRIFKSKGAMAGMLVPVTYAVGATFNKEAINQGVTPLATIVGITAIMAIGQSYVLAVKKKKVVKTIKNKKLFRLILLASVFGVGSVGFASLALKDAYTSYALSIRRLDVLITVFLGHKFMGDKNFLRRFFGALIMTIGVVLVSIG